MSKDKKQTIKCDVHSCKYNNTEDNFCDLDEIKFSCTCDNDDCECTNDTICYSFEEDEDCDDDDCDEEEVDDEDAIEENIDDEEVEKE